MAKLYFRYGTVSSAKTLNLLAVAHNYGQQGKKVMVIKPQMDTRFGLEEVRSRAGLERKADLLVQADTRLDIDQFREIDCLLVDEAQFLSKNMIDQLRELTMLLDLPIICYGLWTDFRTQLFAGSQRLMEVADAIEEIKTICWFCQKKAIFNLKFLDNVPTLDGPAIDLGAEEKYLPACHDCYRNRLNPAGTRGWLPA